MNVIPIKEVKAEALSPCYLVTKVNMNGKRKKPSDTSDKKPVLEK